MIWRFDYCDLSGKGNYWWLNRRSTHGFSKGEVQLRTKTENSWKANVWQVGEGFGV